MIKMIKIILSQPGFTPPFTWLQGCPTQSIERPCDAAHWLNWMTRSAISTQKTLRFLSKHDLVSPPPASILLCYSSSSSFCYPFCSSSSSSCCCLLLLFFFFFFRSFFQVNSLRFFHLFLFSSFLLIFLLSASYLPALPHTQRMYEKESHDFLLYWELNHDWCGG